MLKLNMLGRVGMKQYFDNMYKQISQLYPRLSAKEVYHIANLISNELRKLHQDIYQVLLHKHPNNRLYETNFIIRFRDISLYVEVVVD